MPRTTNKISVTDEHLEMKSFYDNAHKKLNLEPTIGTPYPTHVNLHDKHVNPKKVLETDMNS